MDDLSHWDFETSFTAEQVACLILGVDPANIDSIRNKVDPVMRRIDRGYRDALRKCLERHAFSTTDTPYSGNELTGALIEWLEREANRQPYDFDVYAEIEGRWGELHKDHFSRENVARWLAAAGLRSAYQFHLQQEPTTAGRWPWGSHHTEMLGHLEAAARKWWANYDPSDESTAPRNEDVVSWLKAERKLDSDKMAKAIATMLRANGLRTGPR